MSRTGREAPGVLTNTVSQAPPSGLETVPFDERARGSRSVQAFQDTPDTGDLTDSLAELSGLGLSDRLWAGGILLVSIAIGLAGLAIALAFQDLLENIISGIFMSLRRPFDAGHQVSVNGVEGTVESINLRETALVRFDGVRIHLPNAAVWSNPIINYTEFGTRRTTLESGSAPAPTWTPRNW